MAKGKQRHKTLPLDEKILKHHEMFLRKYYGTEMSEDEKEKYLAKTRERLIKVGDTK